MIDTIDEPQRIATLPAADITETLKSALSSKTTDSLRKRFSVYLGV